MSVLGILIPIVVLLVVMNTGYALWSSKLNISTNVKLDYSAPALAVDVPKKENGQYVATTGFVSGTGRTAFDVVSEELSENSLTTTIKVHREQNVQLFSSNITVGFVMKNTAKDGSVYTDGKATQMEVSDSGGAVTKVSASVMPTTVSSGGSAEFKFAGRVDARKVSNTVCYKYAISYEVDGVTRYFYYTLKILPPDTVE